mgnify:FL=1
MSSCVSGVAGRARGGDRLRRFDESRQAGYLARSGFSMQNAFFSGFVDGRLGNLELLRTLRRIVAGGCRTHIFNDAFDLGFDGTVAQPPNFILQGTFFR